MRASAILNWGGRGAASFVFLLFFCLFSCDEKKSESESGTLKKPEAAAPVAPKPAPPPFPIGTWEAQARLGIVKGQEDEPPEGAKAEKKPEAEGAAAAAGASAQTGEALEMTLEVQPDGVISGSASLGAEKAKLSGRHEGEMLRIDLRGVRVKGSFVASHEGEGFVGSLRASTWREHSEPRYLALQGQVRLQAVNKQP